MLAGCALFTSLIPRHQVSGSGDNLRCPSQLNPPPLLSGAAYGRAEAAVRRLVELSGAPFLPTPMGKGVLPDDHPQCVSAAR